MGVFQSGINNILMQAGIGARLVSDKIKDVKAEQEAESKKIEANKQAEIEKATADEQAQKEYEAKMNEAIDLAMGYSKEQINARRTAESLGVDFPKKNPRGVNNKTFARRLANAESFRKISADWQQKEDWIERRKFILESKSEDLANAFKPTIRSRKKIGGDK